MNLAPGQVPDLPMGIAVQFSLMPGHTADMCWWEHVVCKEEASEEGNPSLASDAVGAPPASLPSSPLLDLSYFMVRVFLFSACSPVVPSSLEGPSAALFFLLTVPLGD